MVLHNPNNWHWVNKNAAGWTKQWLEENLAGVEAEEGGVSAKVTKLVSMDGDVDVNQRKGKVITIFDVKLVLEYSGQLDYNLTTLMHKNSCADGAVWQVKRLKMKRLLVPLPFQKLPMTLRRMSTFLISTFTPTPAPRRQ